MAHKILQQRTHGFAFFIGILFLCQAQAQQRDEFAAVDAYALGILRSDASSMGQLATSLASGARNDREKARVIYRWITKNISYDTHAFFSGNFGDMSPDNVLKSMKGVCDGYAELFQALAQSMGLESQKIIGNSKGYGYVVGSRIDGPANHAWNAVKVYGEWRLVDCTWGAGYIDADKKFVSRFNNFYFLTPPDQFVYDHFPDDPDKQFLSRAVSKETYENYVNVQPTFWRCALNLLSHREGIIRASKRLDVVINAPDDAMLMMQLLRNGEPMESNLTYVYRTRSDATLTAVFPERGSYVFRLFAKRRSDPGSQYDKALDYQVIVSEPLSNPVSFPVLFDAFVPYGLSLKSNAERNTRVDRNVSIDLASTVDLAMIASLERDGMKLADGSTFVQSEEGNHRVQAVFSQPGKFVLTVYAKRPSESGNYNAVLSYSFTSSTSNDPSACFPVEYEQYRQWNAHLYSPFEGCLDANKPHLFRISVPAAEAVAVVNNGHWTALKSNNGLFAESVVMSPGKAEVFVKGSGSKQYIGLLRYEIVP